MKISVDQSKDLEVNDHQDEDLDAVVVQEAMLQEGAEIDSSVLESLAGPPGQPQTIVLLSSGKSLGQILSKYSGADRTACFT